MGTREFTSALKKEEVCQQTERSLRVLKISYRPEGSANSLYKWLMEHKEENAVKLGRTNSEAPLEPLRMRVQLIYTDAEWDILKYFAR